MIPPFGDTASKSNVGVSVGIEGCGVTLVINSDNGSSKVTLPPADAHAIAHLLEAAVAYLDGDDDAADEAGVR